MGALEIVKNTIEEKGLLRSGDSVVVGFSGGPDSICLLHVLWRLGKESKQWKLYAVHVNHQLRGQAAERDQAFAEEFCRRHGIPCYVYRFDVNKIAAQQGLSTEDAGRRVRYAAFEEVRQKVLKEDMDCEVVCCGGGKENCKEVTKEALNKTLKEALKETAKASNEENCQTNSTLKPARRCFIAVAQNANDQAETVLMRMMRGTGIAGLGAMDYKREDGILRPLLDVSREEIEKYCEQQKLEPCIDHTNLQPDYTRNRIRLELIPCMKEHFNVNVVGALHRLAEIAREDDAFLCHLADQQIRQVQEAGQAQEIRQAQEAGQAQEIRQAQEAGQALRFPLALLQEQPDPLRRRIIMELLRRLGLDKNIGMVHLEQADRILKTGRTSAAVDFPMGYRMRISYEDVIFEKEHSVDRAKQRGFEFLNEQEIRMSGEMQPDCGDAGVGSDDGSISSSEVKLGIGAETIKMRLVQKIVKREDVGDPKKMERNCRAFDERAIRDSGFEPMLRTRRVGDYIRPLGMKGTKKLQDYFVDKKIERAMRDEIPLVCLGCEVIWVWDGAIGEAYKMRPETENVLLLQMKASE